MLGITDTITVLRDGKKVAATASSGIDHDALTRLIVGHDIERSTGRDEALHVAGPAVLRLDHVAGGSVVDVSAVVHQGEIVGIAGLSGSGRETLASLITGRLPRRGVVQVDGVARRAAEVRAPRWPPAWRRCRRTGPLRHLSQPQRPPEPDHGVAPASPPPRAHRRRRRAPARSGSGSTISGSSPAAPTPRSPACRAATSRRCSSPGPCASRPRVLVLDDPTAGIDVGAREQVHRIIEDNTTDTMAVLLVSTDSDELARLCDRVLIMNRGRVSRELRRGVDLSAEAHRPRPGRRGSRMTRHPIRSAGLTHPRCLT